ncbi:MAG: hypothetical protein CMJ76_14360 [Planctomycetaceae bacterium]|nr:hypothetical protein [Planctomycetaceae bacterium]
MTNGKSFYLTTCTAVILVLLNTSLFGAPVKRSGDDQGKRIYLKQCAHCHGAEGEGVVGVNENPLYGNKKLPELIQLIVETMPEDKPSICKGENAVAVGRYIFEKFYTPEARASQKPPRIELARLTNRQYRQTVGDLFTAFLGKPELNEDRGIHATYYDTRGFGKQVEQEIVDNINFDFDQTLPHEKISKAEEFSIRWQGAIIAEESGIYEFIVKSPNSIRLYINDRERRLVDKYVATRDSEAEHSGTIYLQGGLPYFFRLETFRFKDPTASMSLMWIPPGGTRQVIPKRNFYPATIGTGILVQTPFPPDDSASGYERGIAVSAEWDQAATNAAIEVAQQVLPLMDQMAKTKSGDADRNDKLQAFCHSFVEYAFRRPLTGDQKAIYVDSFFSDDLAISDSVMRVVIATLKSPLFLYPELSRNPKDPLVDSYLVAGRLALALWDSVPDTALRNAAERGDLLDPIKVQQQIKRMLNNTRAKSKLDYFLLHWLQLNEKGEFSKDTEHYANFTDTIKADLRQSLRLFFQDVIWSEGSDYRQLFRSPTIPINPTLAQFYGIDSFEGNGFQPGSVSEHAASGILTHPYMLSMLAYRDNSSPIHRGGFITRRLLGRTLKEPPQATELGSAKFADGLTIREKVTQLTEPTACAGCHNIINPLGFSLENFDAIGRYRNQEVGKAINAVANYNTVDGEKVELSGASGLAELITISPQAHGAFVDHLFHQAMKQPINAYGDSLREQLIEQFQVSDFNIQQLLTNIVKEAVLFKPEQEQ